MHPLMAIGSSERSSNLIHGTLLNIGESSVASLLSSCPMEWKDPLAEAHDILIETMVESLSVPEQLPSARPPTFGCDQAIAGESGLRRMAAGSGQ